MKIISTKVHGVLDYLVGVLLIAAPWLLGFAANGWETWVPSILGISTIIYSLMTDYEMGLSDNISMRTHIMVDIASGVLLAASPWIFGFADIVYLPHLILGITEILAASLTTTKTGSHAMLHHQGRHSHHARLGTRSRTAHG